jgi:hypothetical protein
VVSPNPIVGEAVLTFTNATNEAHEVTMTTVSGQVVRRIEGVTSSNLVIERAELNAGMYFITIRNTKGEAVTRRVIMQ